MLLIHTLLTRYSLLVALKSALDILQTLSDCTMKATFPGRVGDQSSVAALESDSD